MAGQNWNQKLSKIKGQNWFLRALRIFWQVEPKGLQRVPDLLELVKQMIHCKNG